MRQGKSPQESCEIAISRIIEQQKNTDKFQVGFLALNKKGEHGAYALREKFQYAINSSKKNGLVNCPYV